MGGKLKWVAGLTVLATLAAACGGGDGGGGTNTTVVMTKEGGDAQTATVATTLATQLRVRVRQGGENKPGATVTWETNGNGTTDPATSITSSTGVATTTWTLGTAAGQQAVQASFGATSATFTATAEPGPAASFGIGSGDSQSAGINSAFSQVLAAQVTDQYGNGIEGIQVNWAVQSGSVTIGAGSSVTNTSGLAALQVTAGPTVGPAVVRATTAAVAGNVDFNLSVTPRPVRITAGDIYYLSVKNNSTNPAVDTATVGTPVVWTASTGPHSVRSTGTPSFSSGDNISGGQTYTITFTTPGTYTYDCGVHGAAMTGQIVVQP
jgi:adhesin/invasin